MEGKGSFVVLIAVVAFLSLTLAMLAGYVFFVGPSNTNNVVKVTEPIKVPKDEELLTLPLYENKAYFNLKKDSTDKSVSVLQIKAELRYYKTVEGLKDPTVKLEAYKADIKELIGSYFQNLTIDQVKQPESKEKVKKDLKIKINDLLNLNERPKKQIIWDIVFDEWFYQ